MRLLGRRSEREVLDGLLAGARAGRSGVLVVRGEPGVGKTALLKYAIESASDLRVVRAVGVESEIELAFAALHQLCSPLLDRLDRLPGPQREALEITFGLREGAAPDRFLVGLAALSLLSEAAEDRPLVCVVDDVQWLDRASAQVLGFVARRLLAESVVIVFVARDPGEELRTLPELVVEGLRDADARELLASVIPWPLDERVREQILAETRGNPLAVLELPRGLSPTQLAGGFGLLGALSLSGRLEENFVHRFEGLPTDTRRLLLVAAAESAGDPALLSRAAKRLGVPDPVLEPEESAGLLEIGASVRFRHPLARSAVYRTATAEQRRAAHRALGDATDAEVDPDRRAWHLAEATVGPDEDVAAELERAAGRAQARGGLGAAAAFLERATALTIDPSRRGHRALAAAQRKFEAGSLDDALTLLVTAEANPCDDIPRAALDLVRAQIAFASRRGSDAPPLLLRAARELEAVDVRLARTTYLEALSAALFASRLTRGVDVREVARVAREAPAPAAALGAADLLLDGLALRFTDGYSAAAPILKQALRAFRHEPIPPPQEARWLWLACWAASDLWDDECWTTLSTRHLERARHAGALAALPFVLSTRGVIHAISGELDAATSLVDEMRTVSDATGIAAAPYAALWLTALRGRETEASALIDTTVTEAVGRGEGFALSVTEWVSAVMYNGLGRADAALDVLRRTGERADEMRSPTPALAELIEAAAKCGEPQLARAALERLTERAAASGTDWALGIDARSRALLSDGKTAERLYREAIERLARTRVRVELGRAHLVYGEWLRREHRRLEAREQLRTARDMFTAMGVEAFAQRAERELSATGDRVRKRVVVTQKELTAQEVQIARLARDGLSNPEIGARLFISPRTVEYHLHKVFSKLGISSRNALDQALASESSPAPPR